MFVRKVASNRPKKHLIELFKLCRENHRVQSKISAVFFSIKFRFETKIGYFVAFAQFFAHIFSQLTMTPYLLRQGPHKHIYSIAFVIRMMLMNLFFCQYSFANITVIPVCFYYIIFCFKFYYPTVDIVNHLYLLVGIKPTQNILIRAKKTHSDIILVS